jgi:hypothetical protein
MCGCCVAVLNSLFYRFSNFELELEEKKGDSKDAVQRVYIDGEGHRQPRGNGVKGDEIGAIHSGHPFSSF